VSPSSPAPAAASAATTPSSRLTEELLGPLADRLDPAFVKPLACTLNVASFAMALRDPPIL